MKLMQLLRKISLSFMLLLVITTAYAAYPLWTFTPSVDYPPQVALSASQTATVVYTVQNQSYKSKSLAMKPIHGVAQVSSCRLAPMGQPGSSCSLILAVTGLILINVTGQVALII